MEFSKSFPIQLVAAVDVHSQKNRIEDFLKKGRHEIDITYVDPLDSNQSLSKKTVQQLDKLIASKNISGVIISTEPLAHKAYAKWALDNELNILMDKPITTRKHINTDILQATGLISDYEELLNQYKSNQVRKQTIFSINTQRRYDSGFKHVHKLITEAKDRFNIPVTSIQAMYADGTWLFPNEIITQDSHPYKYGYGMCSHSAYHIFDIIWQFYKAGSIEDKFPDSMQVYSSFLTPKGYSMQITEDDYASFLNHSYKSTGFSKDEYASYIKDFGEIDAFNIIRLLKEGENICNVSMNLMHNSFSRRAWSEPNTDLYKGNGRVKHQQFVIQQGPFQSIHIHNYQASDKHDIDNSQEFEIGGNNHFDIYVFRNAAMFGTDKPFYKLSSKDILTGSTDRLTVEKAKDSVIYEFLQFILGAKEKKDLISNIDSHSVPVKIMSTLYQSHILSKEGKNPIVTTSLT